MAQFTRDEVAGRSIAAAEQAASGGDVAAAAEPAATVGFVVAVGPSRRTMTEV